MEGRGRGAWRPYAAKIAVLAAAYYGAAKLGLNLAFASPSVTAIWAPTGIALAAVLLWGYRVWPGVALGALLANGWTGVPFYAVLGITAGNTLEALAGAYLLRELADFRASLERVKDVLALAVLGGVVSTTISASIGVTSLLVGNEIASADFGSVWRTWWLGDMGGDLLVAPAILVAVTHWPYRRAPGRPLEAVALAASALGVSALVFTHDTPLIFVLFPLGVWAALRFWQPGAVVGILLVASVAIPLTEDDRGPFAGPSSRRQAAARAGLPGHRQHHDAGAGGGDHRAQAGREGGRAHRGDPPGEPAPVAPARDTRDRDRGRVPCLPAGNTSLEATSTTCSSAMTKAGR